MNNGVAEARVVIHGLFFMIYNSSTGNLEILAPKITDHHFAGGVKGSRAILSGEVNLTSAGLTPGLPDLPGDDPTKVPNDIKGPIMQFSRDETGVGDLLPYDTSRYLGRIILPWPGKFHAIRCNDISTSFPYVKTSVIGSRIEINSRNKGSSMVGIVTCLRYRITDQNSLPWPVGKNPHFYLQPCFPHDPKCVNQDLEEAAQCFTYPDKFDLRLQDVLIGQTQVGSNYYHDDPPNWDKNDEYSLEEDKSNFADVQSICASSSPPKCGKSVEAVSPANCPTFFVG